MITTPQGAERHYTLSYAEFCHRLETKPSFAAWFEQVGAGQLPCRAEWACTQAALHAVAKLACRLFVVLAD